MHEDLILIGRVVGAHGIRGAVKVLLYTEAPSILETHETVLLKNKSAETKELSLDSVRVKGKSVLLVFSEMKSRSEAERMIGSELYVPLSSLGKADDEYYWHEIIGLTVLLENGHTLGRVKSIIPTGSNDVYVVEDGLKEYLIPAVEGVVTRIDLSGRVMIVRPLDGLLNINDI